MTEAETLSKRFFRALDDAALTSWRPEAGGNWAARCANIGAANREMRRRSKKAGFISVYEWLDHLKGTVNE